MTDSGFLLKLGDDSGWTIVATSGTKSWVEKFAKIMKLKAGEEERHCEFSKLFFISRHPRKGRTEDPINFIDSNVRDGLPRSGWKGHDLRSLWFWTHQTAPDVICEIGPEKDDGLDIVRMWMSLQPIYKRVQDSGGLPFHAALVEWNGNGVLLSAPGDTGKSTCCRLLPPPWNILCDDETPVTCNNQGHYLAHPFPTWSDYLLRRSQPTWDVQQRLPLSAIFFLEQAESDEVVPIGQGEAAILINRSATDVSSRMWYNLGSEEQRKLRKELFANASQLARIVPAYILRFTLNGRFWEEMGKVL